MATIEERVARGAAWLDANRDGWFDAIDLDILLLRSPCNCVLGQLDGSYDDSPALNEIDTVAHGFMAGGLGWSGKAAREFADLDNEWRRVITERRAAA